VVLAVVLEGQRHRQPAEIRDELRRPIMTTRMQPTGTAQFASDGWASPAIMPSNARPVAAPTRLSGHLSVLEHAQVASHSGPVTRGGAETGVHASLFVNAR
jgi:hypothetical protein